MTEPVVTMLEADVDDEARDRLVDAYRSLADEMPESILESFLLRVPDTSRWRIVTVFRSRAELEAMRQEAQRTGTPPGGVRVFRSVGAEPELTVHDVAAHLTHGADRPTQEDGAS